MPVRTSAAERDAYQRLLDALPKASTRDAVAEAVAEIKTRRENNLSEGSPEADLSEEGHVKYTVDFDAKGMQGKHLRYRAQCDFNADDKLTFKIRPRRTAQKDANP